MKVIDARPRKAMLSRNLISAIFISVHLAVILVILYVFFPVLSFLLAIVLRGMFSQEPHGPESNGIVAVAGGVSDLVVQISVVAAMLFVLVFVLLQKRSRKH
jgi:hypothetical protein